MCCHTWLSIVDPKIKISVNLEKEMLVFRRLAKMKDLRKVSKRHVPVSLPYGVAHKQRQVKRKGVGGRDGWLAQCAAALPEDPGLVPNTHTVQPPVVSAPEDLTPSVLLGDLHTHGILYLQGCIHIKGNK